jgi:peptide deformylase
MTQLLARHRVTDVRGAALSYRHAAAGTVFLLCLTSLGGCATTLPRTPSHVDASSFLSREERALISTDRPRFEIITRSMATSAVLRRRSREVPPELDLAAVASRMQRTMRQAGGVGIAGPQVGLSLRIAVLALDYRTPHPRTLFVRNPTVVERSDETLESYEGCLSVPALGGLVRRDRRIRVTYTDARGERVETAAEGPNAVLWQHEIDHLDGILYLDRLTGPLLPIEEMRRRRKELEDRR